MSWADGGDPAVIRGRGHRLGHMSHGQNGHMPLETLLDCGFLNLDLQKILFIYLFLFAGFSAKEQKAVLVRVSVWSGGNTCHTRWGRRKKELIR